MLIRRQDDDHRSAAPTISDGALVVVYERYDSMKAVYVDSKRSYDSRYGHFPMKGWVGRPYGCVAYAATPKEKEGSSRGGGGGAGGGGWLYLLAATPELWTQVLRHRTQILYAADISLVCTFLELRPGCTVLETGTGSGSLTTSLARAVAPTGQVHTFEFHELRAQAAREDFEKNGIGHLVTVEHRNTEQDGFPEHLHGSADGVFLDLPGPYRVVPSAAACLRPDGIFCSFSPCIEQVQRTCEELVRHGFVGVRTMECLLRQHQVTTLDFAALPAERERPAGGGDTQAEQAGARKRKLEEAQAVTTEGEEQAARDGEGGGGGSAGGMGGAEEEQGAGGGSKKDNAAAAGGDNAVPAPGAAGKTTQQQLAAGAAGGGGRQAGGRRLVVSKPSMDARGHTGYLTFARKGLCGAQSA